MKNQDRSNFVRGVGAGNEKNMKMGHIIYILINCFQNPTLILICFQIVDDFLFGIGKKNIIASI